MDIHPGDMAKTAQSPENDLVRPPQGDQAIPVQFGDFTGNGLDGHPEVVGDVEAPEWHVNLDRRYRICTGSPGDIEEEGGDAFVGAGPTKAHDLILRSRHLVADCGETLRAEILAVVDELIEAVPSKPFEPDRCYGFCRARIDVAGRNAEQIASVAEPKNSTSAIVHDAIQPKAALQHMKDVRGLIPFPEDRPRRCEGLSDLGKEESLQGPPSGVRSRDRVERRGEAIRRVTMRSGEREGRVEHDEIPWAEGNLTPGRYDADDRSRYCPEGHWPEGHCPQGQWASWRSSRAAQLGPPVMCLGLDGYA
jgi:hypothetical protein